MAVCRQAYERTGADGAVRKELTFSQEESACLSAAMINAWFLKEGLLFDVSPSGRKLPTEAGRKIGLLRLRDDSGRVKGGTYWSPAAQQFLLLHMREIVLYLRSGKEDRGA